MRRRTSTRPVPPTSSAPAPIASAGPAAPVAARTRETPVGRAVRHEHGALGAALGLVRVVHAHRGGRVGAELSARRCRPPRRRRRRWLQVPLAFCVQSGQSVAVPSAPTTVPGQTRSPSSGWSTRTTSSPSGLIQVMSMVADRRLARGHGDADGVRQRRDGVDAVGRERLDLDLALLTRDVVVAGRAARDDLGAQRRRRPRDTSDQQHGCGDNGVCATHGNPLVFRRTCDMDVARVQRGRAVKRTGETRRTAPSGVPGAAPDAVPTRFLAQCLRRRATRAPGDPDRCVVGVLHSAISVAAGRAAHREPQRRSTPPGRASR